MNDNHPADEAVAAYTRLVSQKYPQRIASWPIVTGFNVKIGGLGNTLALMLIHTGSPTRQYNGVGDLVPVVQTDQVGPSNKEATRAFLRQHFGLGPRDGIIFVDDGVAQQSEYERLMQQHELALGLAPIRIFLSHKGSDKARIRNFEATLNLLGFSAWVDESAMPAGTTLDRGLLKGFGESCAVVFFITEAFKDEGYLATEIEYARAQKRNKGDRFAIITLVFGNGVVPPLLETFVYKNPSSDLEAMREIVRALPIKLGPAFWP